MKEPECPYSGWAVWRILLKLCFYASAQRLRFPRQKVDLLPLVSLLTKLHSVISKNRIEIVSLLHDKFYNVETEPNTKYEVDGSIVFC